MVSIQPTGDAEPRHFFDGDRQITIGLQKSYWLLLEQIAVEQANKRGWLEGGGITSDYLEIWIIGQVSSCPKNLQAWDWIKMADDDLFIGINNSFVE
jgi:hypothetical protein